MLTNLHQLLLQGNPEYFKAIHAWRVFGKNILPITIAGHSLGGGWRPLRHRSVNYEGSRGKLPMYSMHQECRITVSSIPLERSIFLALAAKSMASTFVKKLLRAHAHSEDVSGEISSDAGDIQTFLQDSLTLLPSAAAFSIPIEGKNNLSDRRHDVRAWISTQLNALGRVE